jgi:hypothetical protein
MSAELAGSAHKIVHTNRQPNCVRQLGSKGAIHIKLVLHNSPGSFATLATISGAVIVRDKFLTALPDLKAKSNEVPLAAVDTPGLDFGFIENIASVDIAHAWSAGCGMQVGPNWRVFVWARETGFCGAETAASKRPVTFNRSSAETKPETETDVAGDSCMPG